MLAPGLASVCMSCWQYNSALANPEASLGNRLCVRQYGKWNICHGCFHGATNQTGQNFFLLDTRGLLGEMKCVFTEPPESDVDFPPSGVLLQTPSSSSEAGLCALMQNTSFSVSISRLFFPLSRLFRLKAPKKAPPPPTTTNLTKDLFFPPEPRSKNKTKH